MRWWLAVAAAGALAACGSPTYAGSTSAVTRARAQVPAPAFRATVSRVVDGDTFIARRGGRDLRVRLIGVNAPESVKPNSPVECYGPEASRALHRLLPEGTAVRATYEPGGERDQFGRELWDVWLPDGQFLQRVLVARGVAEARLYRPQHAYAGLLARVEDQARTRGSGLWGRCR